MSQSNLRSSASTAGWEALCRTAAAVRVDPEVGCEPPARRRHRPPGRVVLAGAMLGAALFVGSHLQGQPAAADATADSDLFSLTNQDRTSNGVAALVDDPTLDAIGEAAPYSGCGGAGTIDGRAQDMINRNYFAHQIPPCNQYVFSMMSAFGVDYRSAGENIGWESGYGSGSASANAVAAQFESSPEHQANILNPNFTDLGVGSATTASGQSWTGAGGPLQGVWMFAEEFAQLPGAATAPPATAPPASAPPATAPPATAPPASAPPAATPTPTPTPTPVPTATPTPVPAPHASATPSVTTSLPLPAYAYHGQGLISETIESTLEAFLFD